MTMTRSELLTEHRKVETEDTELSHLPSYLSLEQRATPISAPRTSVLEEALLLTTRDRQDSYGRPETAFGRAAALWTSLLGSRLKSPITAQEVGLMMVLLKLSRQMHKSKRDNLVDAAGYINCAHMVIEAEENA